MRLLMCFIELSTSAFAVELSIPLPSVGTDINGNRFPADANIEPFFVLEDVQLKDILNGSLSFDGELVADEQYDGVEELFHLFSIDMVGVTFEFDETKKYDYRHTLITDQITIVEKSLNYNDDRLNFSWHLPGEQTIDGLEWWINDIGFDDAIVDASFSFYGPVRWWSFRSLLESLS